MKTSGTAPESGDRSGKRSANGLRDNGAHAGGDGKQRKKSGAGSSRLMTFKKPAGSLLMTKAVIPLVRWLFLGGIPGLRSVPGLNRIPGIRGVSNVTSIDFPSADEARLKEALSPNNATFVTPNHPEFFTDWMLDKTIVGRISPLAAFWATHVVVNGMGAVAQRFWLKNNLIAQIPGGAGKAGKEFSIDYALGGHGVLLHPEGNVGWHGDLIAPLFSGAVDMALEAARRADNGVKAVVAPIVWKLVFTRDVGPALRREFDLVERILKLPSGRAEFGLAKRLYGLYDALLARDEKKYGVAVTNAAYFDRHERLVVELLSRLERQLDALDVEPVLSGSSETSTVRDFQIRRGERWLRGVKKRSAESKSVRAMTGDLRRLLRFVPGTYRVRELSQEHIGESIKRIRNDYCTKTTRDLINKFVPQPVGSRRAIVRVPEPLDISAMMATRLPLEIVEELRHRMQACLDDINRELAASGTMIYEPNPFVIGREACAD